MTVRRTPGRLAPSTQFNPERSQGFDDKLRAAEERQAKVCHARRVNLAAMPTVEQVREALVEVKDPELNLGILELGLVYDITTEGANCENVTVMMTLTSPMCPVGPMFKKSVEDRVLAIEGVKNANVEITFTPPWDPASMASDDVKAMLGMW